MVQFNELLVGLGSIPNSGPMNADISGIAYDSRRVNPGDLFVAIPGTQTDGHRFLEEAVQRGAAGLVVRNLADTSVKNINAPVAMAEVSDIRAALAIVTDRFYGHPSGQVRVIGITGTNGKTTCTYLTESILRAAGRSTGVIGTIAYRWDLRNQETGQIEYPASQTTPEAPDLQGILRKMADASVEYCLMEVSSHGLSLGRVRETTFEAAVFTNLTQDHMDYHGTLEDYYQVKRSLFLDYPVGQAVVNLDDPQGVRLWSDVKKHLPGTSGITFGLTSEADVRAQGVEGDGSGQRFRVTAPEVDVSVHLRLFGRHNVSNALAATAASLALGISPEAVAEGLGQLENTPGRFERIDMGQPFLVVVDYAHTENALRHVLQTAREIINGRLIAVMGCGGDRDRIKRPLMGAAAAEIADHVVITSDNPRTEEPEAILADIESGILKSLPDRTRYETCVDRREAISRALKKARAGDGVIIAGKGHENYQIVEQEVFAFDDREEARQALRALGFKRTRIA